MAKSFDTWMGNTPTFKRRKNAAMTGFGLRKRSKGCFKDVTAREVTRALKKKMASALKDGPFGKAGVQAAIEQQLYGDPTTSYVQRHESVRAFALQENIVGVSTFKPGSQRSGRGADCWPSELSYLISDRQFYPGLWQPSSTHLTDSISARVFLLLCGRSSLRGLYVGEVDAWEMNI